MNNERSGKEFNPDYKVHPGVILEEELNAKALTQSDLAKRTGLTTKTINTIIKGGASISPDTAVIFETVLGKPAVYWLSLDANYQINRINKAQHESLQEDLQLLRKIDLKSIIRRKWISKYDDEVEQLLAVLAFFGVSSGKQLSLVWSQLDVNYRTSQVYQKNHYNIMLWLRRGELQGQGISCEPYDSKKFKLALSECRKLTNLPFEDINSKIQGLCANSGVAVVFVPELANISTSGSAKWLSKDKALIQLSLRGKKDDLFWFSFFHEAAHILLHGRKDQFLDNNNRSIFYSPERKLIEVEADDFAANFLIPKKSFSKFILEGDFSSNSIKKFSRKMNIAPGITVGQLQNNKYIRWATSLNKLKKTYDFSNLK